jgi:hypothetical protein
MKAEMTKYQDKSFSSPANNQAYEDNYDKVFGFDYSIISEGVRDLVREIREVHSMETCDSGDGSNYQEGMECALPDRHVFMYFEERVEAENAKIYLAEQYPEACVQITDEDDNEGDFVLLWPDGEPSE